MRSIMERCTKLRAGLKELKRATDDETRAQVLEERRAELEMVRERLALVVASAQVLVDHEHLAARSLPDCTKPLESCDKVDALIQQGPAAITKGRDYKYLLSRVGKAVEQLKASNEQSWQAVVSRHQGVDEAFLRRVEMFPGQAQTVERIRQLKGRYDETTADIPASEEAYLRFEARYAALQQELTTLDPEAFPDDVLVFFRAAHRGVGAPLSLFTDKVRDWLEENGFLDHVHVRFTGAN